MIHTRLWELGATAGLILAATFVLLAATAAAAEFPQGLEVSGDTEYQDTTVEVTGELRVAAGGSLTLDGVTVLIEPNEDGLARFVVEPGATLTMRDGEVRPRDYSAADVSVELLGVVDVRGTVFSGLAAGPSSSSGSQLANGYRVPWGGLKVASASAYLEEVTVTSSRGCGLWLAGSGAHVVDLTIRALRPVWSEGAWFAAGVCVSGGSPTVEGLDLDGLLAVSAEVGSSTMLAGIVAKGTTALTVRGIQAEAMLLPGGAEPAWSAAMLLEDTGAVIIEGGQIANAQYGIVHFTSPGAAVAPSVKVSGLTMRVLSHMSISQTGTFTIPANFQWDNLSIDEDCGANAVYFLSDGSTAQVDISLDNITAIGCTQAGIYIHARNTQPGGITNVLVKSSDMSYNGEEGLYIRGENVQAAVNPTVAWSTATRNGFSGMRVQAVYPGGSTAIATARFDYNTAVNNSIHNTTSVNGGGFSLELGSPNTLALRYNNNTALGNVPIPPGSANHWGHWIQVSVRSSMVVVGMFMAGNVAIENGGYGVVLIGGAGSSSRFDKARMRESTIQLHGVGIHAENARVEVWTTLMNNGLEFEGLQTDFIIAGTVHNRLSGTTSGVRTIQSYKAIDINAVWQNDRPVANTSVRFINGSGSSASVYSTLTPRTLATNLMTDAQGHWSGWVLDWLFDPNLPASQNQRADFAPLTIAVIPQAEESRSDPFDLVTNVVGEVVFLDEDPPVIIVRTPRDNGTFTTTDLNVTGIVTDQISGVARLQVSLDGSNWTEVYPSGGNFAHAIVGLADATYDIYLRAWDRANDGLSAPNISIVVLNAVRIDTQPPKLELILPKLFDGDTYYTNQPVMSFQGAVDATIVSLFMNGIRITWTGSFFAVQPELTSEGPQTFLFLALDAAGNARQITITVIKDTFPPTLILTSPQVKGDIYVKTRLIELRGITDDNTNLTVGSTNVTVVNRTFVVPVSLVEGRNTILLYAEDIAGNVAERTIVVWADTSDPGVTIDSVSDGEWVNTSRVLIAGTVSEPVTSVSIGLFVVPVTGGAFSATLPLLDGIHSITVRAVDLAGNVGTATVDLIVDTVAPSVSFLGLPEGLTVSNSRLNVRGSISEPSTLFVNGVQVELTGNGFDARVDLEEGANLLTILAVDLAGNERLIERVVTMDTQAPGITVTEPLEGATVHEALVVVRGKTEPNATVVVAGHFVQADENGEFMAHVLLPASGSNIIVLDIRDQAGNSASVTVTLHLTALVEDTLGPLIMPVGVAAALVAGLAVAGLFLARRSVKRKVKEFVASQPAPPVEAEAGAPPAPPRPPRAPRAPRPPRPPEQ